MIETVHLIRHGQTDWNIQGRWQGTLPVGLNDDGWRQARALAAHMRRWPVRAVVTSDLPRAYQTASVLAEALGLTAETDTRWREFDLGIFQGHTREELLEKYPAEWHTFREQYWDYVVPNGESRRMMQARLHAAWQDLTARQDGPAVVAVSHGGAIKVLLYKLFGQLPELADLHIENTSITTIERDGRGWRLAGVASSSHLPAAAQSDRSSL